jgi:lipoprotein NlpI
MFIHVVGTIATLISLGAQPPTPGSDDAKAAYAICVNGGSAPEAAVAACSTVIGSGTVNGVPLGFIYFLRGKNLSLSGREEPAARDFASALRANPRLPEQLVVFGYAKRRLRAHGAAIEAFSDALRLHPDFLPALQARADSYADLGRAAEAVADYSEMLRREPSGSLYIERGIAYTIAPDYEKALADFAEAIRREPDNGTAYRARGYALYDMGRPDAAAADFAAAATRDPNDAYAVIWRYLATARAGGDGRAALERDAARLDLGKWPGQIVEVLLGRRDPVEVTPAGADSLAAQAGALCETHFYIGEWHLLHGQREEAVAYLRAAVGTGVTEFVEHREARLELKRLGD